MQKTAPNELVEGLLQGRIAIRIPDDYKEACLFLQRLEAAAPGLTWANGQSLTDFLPRQNAGNQHYHKCDSLGLMYDRREYLAQNHHPQFVDAEEVFNDTLDLSDILNELL